MATDVSRPIRADLDRLELALSSDSVDDPPTEAHEAGQVVFRRLSHAAGVVELLEELLAENMFDGEDTAALSRLYRQLDNGSDDGGPIFTLRPGRDRAPA